MKETKSILVGLDFDVELEAVTDGSANAARRAAWLATESGARLEFLNSTYVNAEDALLISPSEATRRAWAEPILAECASTNELIFSEERPWIAITRRALDGKNDFVVVAKRNQSRGKDVRFGSVSIKLIHKCPCPVWVVKPEHTLAHRSILAATDLTPVGDMAVEYGAYLAHAQGCELHVVHAWQMPMELQLSASRIGDEECTRQKQQIADAAEQHIRSMPQVDALGEQVKVIVGLNSPSRLICQVVQRDDPDLVVMGSISRGGVAGMLVGNTAEKVFHSLDCSVLTVKPPDFVCPLK